jgi:hypothetical protein
MRATDLGRRAAPAAARRSVKTAEKTTAPTGGSGRNFTGVAKVQRTDCC